MDGHHLVYGLHDDVADIVKERDPLPVAALASTAMAEEHEEPDLAARQREIAAAMDETLERQAEIRRRQDALLEQLGGIDRALDKRAGDEPGDGPEEGPAASRP